jgi:hypothetical protein
VAKAKSKSPSDIQISYPKAGKPISFPDFVAYGEASAAVHAIAGVVIGLDSTGAPKLYLGQTLAGPPHWAVSFSKVGEGSYVLWIFDPTNWLLSAKRSFKDKKAPVKSKITSGGLIVNNPACPDTVSPSFCAFGTSGVTPLSGKMTGHGGGVLNGIVLHQPTLPGDPNWCIQFNFPPPPPPFDNPYTLEVDGPTGASLWSCATIHVGP